MARKMKVRTTTKDGQIEVLVLAYHPMETGQRKDKKTKQPIPAHFIKELTVSVNGKPAVVCEMGIGISEDPLLGFRLPGAKAGDKLQISWVDNKGEKASTDAVIEA